MTHAVPGLILAGRVGSHAYGLATPDSDEDYLGVFMGPLKDVLSIGGSLQTRVCHNPDGAYHELQKFCSLALAANPTILELLWLNEYTTQTGCGYWLVSLREAFLSERVRKTYGGYAFQQLNKLLRRGDGSFSSQTRKRREKHARHLARLLIQGHHLLTTGSLNVRLAGHEVEMVRWVGQRDDHGLQQWFAMKDAELQEAKSVLPPAPDYDQVNDWLYEVRLARRFW